MLGAAMGSHILEPGYQNHPLDEDRWEPGEPEVAQDTSHLENNIQC